MALKVGELFASFNLDTSGVSGAIDSAEKKMSSMGKSLMLGGAGMTAAITAPVTKAFTQIYSAGTDFDAEMSKVFAIAGDSVTGSAETMEALRNKALEMGSTTQFTATEAGEALEYMAMAGWKSDQMLSAIGPIMNLAAAAGADLGTTSDIVTDAMTAFGISVTDTWKTIKDGKEIDTGINNVEHFADILAAASSNANTNVTMLGESFKYAAPVAGTLGINAEDTAIALGLMANAGIKASQAGTSLRTGLTNMVKPSKQMREAMEKYGIGLVQNKDGSVNLRETMIQLRKTMSGMTETEQAAAATAIFGKHSMAGWLAIVNASDEDFNKLTDAIDGATGSAEEMKRVMLDNAKGDVTIFKSALEGLEITLWGLAEGGFRKVVQEATKFVDSFRNANKSTQLGIVKMAGLAAAIGPVMTGLGGLITILPKLARTFAIVSGPAALLSIGLLALGAAAIDSNNDIGKTFTKGMVKANVKMTQLGKTVKAQLPTLTSNMSNFLRSLSTGIKLGLPGIISGLTDILTTAVSAISANMGNIANVSQTIVTTLANSIKTNAPKIIPAVLDLLTNMASALISNIPVVLSGMATVITSLVKEVQNADWGEIATKLRESLEGAIKETGTLFKKLAMGDKYTEEASWADVGMALVTNLMDGIKTGFGNLRDFVGSLLLADDYDPDEDWTTFGTKLIDKVFEGVDSVTSGATDFVSGILDGIASLFSEANLSAATTALTTIAEKLITSVADEIPKLGQHATTILSKLSELLIGNGSEKGLAASATEGAAKLAGAIVTSITQAIPKALDAAGNVLDAGLILAGGILDEITKAFSTTNLDLNISGIIQSLVSNIVRLLPKAFEVGGKVVSAGVKIATELLHSIVEGFNGTEIDADFGEVVHSLIDNVVDAIGGIMDFGGELLTAGAQIAGTIMESISTAMQDLDAAGIAESVGTAALDIVKKLLTGVTNLDQNGDVTAFMTNLRQAVLDTTKVFGDVAGQFAGKLIHYLFAEEGLKAVWDAGKAVGKFIIRSIIVGVEGVGNFFKSAIESALVGFGLITQESLDAMEDAGEALAETAAMALQTGLEGNEYGVSLLDLINWGRYRSSNADPNMDTAAEDAMHMFESAVTSAAANSDTAEAFRDTLLGNVINGSDWFAELLSSGGAFATDASGQVIDFLETLKLNNLNPEDFLPNFEDLDFWGALYQALKEGDNASVANLINEMVKASIDLSQFETDASSEAQEAVEEVREAINNTTKELTTPAVQEVNKAAAESAPKATLDAMEKVYIDGASTVSEAAQVPADAAVQAFLLTLSEENGITIADSFLGGIITVLEDGTVVSAFDVLADDSYNAVVAILNAGKGFTIGRNFGQGLVNGINAMIDDVAAAAAALGQAAAGALSGSIEEGSPSRLTAETGRNFGLGFINSIMDSASDAGNAAMMVGLAAAESLEESVGQISGSAAEEMSISPRTQRSEADVLAEKNEKTAQTYASAIANALSGARVMMNGVLVGELVTDTVSEGIASRYSGMRYGTV